MNADHNNGWTALQKAAEDFRKWAASLAFNLLGAPGWIIFSRATLAIVVDDAAGDTVMCPGHGPWMKVGEEKQQNPFIAN
jgi:hypothetical protein